MADKDGPLLTANFFVCRNFAFLQAAARDFTTKYSARRIRTCNAYALDKDFRGSLRSTLNYYNTNSKVLSRDQKIDALMTQVEDMRSILGRNITLLIERETKIDRLMEKSEQTRRDSLVFKRNSNHLKRATRNKSYKMAFLIAGIFLLLSLLLIFVLVKEGSFKGA